MSHGLHRLDGLFRKAPTGGKVKRIGTLEKIPGKPERRIVSPGADKMSRGLHRLDGLLRKALTGGKVKRTGTLEK